jgi:hypothetical protein
MCATQLRPQPSQPAEADASDHDLSVADVLERFKTQSASHYLDLYNVIKGVTLGVAGLALLSIAVPHPSLPRMALWLVGFEGAVLSYYGAVGGAALLSRRPSLRDIVFPMLLSVAELMMIYRPGAGELVHEPAHVWMPTDWFALLGAWQILCGCVIITVSQGLNGSDHHPRLKPVVEIYHEWITNDRNMAVFAGSVTLALFVVWNFDLDAPAWLTGHWARGAFVALSAVFMAAGINNQQRCRRDINENLVRVRDGKKLKSPKLPPPPRRIERRITGVVRWTSVQLRRMRRARYVGD